MAKNLRAILPVGLTALGKHDHLRDTRRGRLALLLLLLIGGCAKNPHPDHIPGISCPQEGHGKCPFGCDE